MLAGRPHPVTLGIAGFGPVVFCHGTPRDDDEVVLVDTRLERWADAFTDLPDTVQTVVSLRVSQDVVNCRAEGYRQHVHDTVADPADERARARLAGSQTSGSTSAGCRVRS
jgi:hypothetical protein